MTSTVMIVDDNADILEALQLMVELAGLDALCFGDGRDALHALRTGARPWVILLDLMMPAMDGWEFLEAKGHDDALASIPTILMSGAGEGARATARSAGLPFLGKPFDDDALLAALRACDARLGASGKEAATAGGGAIEEEGRPAGRGRAGSH